MGLLPQTPTYPDSYRDVLTQKVSKKVKTAPALLEKLTLSWLKPSKPACCRQARSCVAQTGQFLRQLHLFFGTPDEVNPAP